MFTWKILEIHAENELIIAARYHCTIKAEDNEVATEGWWHFSEPTLRTPFSEISENMVIDWIKAETMGKIEGRLTEQLQSVSKKVHAPWLPQIFNPSLGA